MISQHRADLLDAESRDPEHRSVLIAMIIMTKPRGRDDEAGIFLNRQTRNRLDR
jgi:hypothetical protein